MKLTKKQKEWIREAVDKNRFNPTLVVKRLIEKGFDMEEAKDVIKTELALIQEETQKNEENDVKRNIAFIVVILISFMGAMMKVTSIYWYLATMTIAALVAYWGHRDKPIAGIVSCVCLVILMPMASTWYFGERTEFAKLEILIPTIMAGLPCYLLYEMLDKMYYDIPY